MMLLQSFILVLLGSLAIEGAPTDAPPKTLSLPLTVSGVDGLPYTIPVVLGGRYIRYRQEGSQTVPGNRCAFSLFFRAVSFRS